MDGNVTGNRTFVPRLFPVGQGDRGEGIHFAGDIDGIVGGEQLPEGVYPFFISIGHWSGHSCGGSLISPRIVLLAARK